MPGSEASQEPRGPHLRMSGRQAADTTCVAAMLGSEASQQPRGPEQGMSGPGRGLPPDPQASEGTVTPALSGGDPQIEASSGELSGDEEGALPDASSPLRPSPRPEASIPVLWDLPHHEGTSKVGCSGVVSSSAENARFAAPRRNQQGGVPWHGIIKCWEREPAPSSVDAPATSQYR